MPKQQIKAVEFEGELRQIKSLTDRSVNVTINVPEYCLPQAQQMMAWIGDSLRVIVQLSGEKTGGD